MRSYTLAALWRLEGGMWSDKIHMKKIWYFLGTAIRSVWLRGIMGVEGGKGGEVSRRNHVKFFGSKVKEFF